MKRRGALFHLAWAGGVWASIGLALPAGILVKTRLRDSKQSEVQQTARSVLDLAAVLESPSSAANRVAVADHTRRHTDSPDGETPLAASTSGSPGGIGVLLNGSLPAGESDQVDHVQPASELVVLQNGTRPLSDSSGAVTGSGVVPARPGASAAVTTVRLQDDELPVNAAAAAGESSGLGMSPLGVGLLTGAGIAAAVAIERYVTSFSP